LPSSIHAQTEITYRGEPAFGPLKFVQPLGIVLFSNETCSI
jgi:hypothetical protein